MTIALQIFDVLWLVCVLVLLYMMWRSSEKRLEHIQKMEQVQFDTAMMSAKAAQEAAKAAQVLAEKINDAG